LVLKGRRVIAEQLYRDDFHIENHLDTLAYASDSMILVLKGRRVIAEQLYRDDFHAEIQRLKPLHSEWKTIH